MRRVLVVSNRKDELLRHKLAALLGAKIVWTDHRIRKIQSAARSIASGHFSLVILITGFLNHTTTTLVRKAARQSSTPVALANRGRPAAIIAAIERDTNWRSHGS